ncbi:MAG: hypothetical protein WCF84_03325 [Anaerolineae bacterium]
MSFTVINRGNQTVVFETTDRPVMGIIVQDALSKEVLLTWSAQNPDKVSHHLEWKPGESKTIELTWTAAEAQGGRNAAMGGWLNQDATTVYPVVGTVDVY